MNKIDGNVRGLINCPSISQLSFDEISAYKKIDGWVQNRGLFDQPCSWCGDNEKNLKEFNPSYLGASSYENLFHGDFLKNRMKDFTSEDIYMDIGAGDGLAIHQYREMYPEGAEVIGIASTQPTCIERVIEEEKKDNKFSFFLKDFLDFPSKSLRGRVSFITDIKGAFRYGLDPVNVIKKMGELLKEGGFAVISLGYGIGINPTLIPEKCITMDDRRKYQIGSACLMHLWFHTIQGFDVIQKNVEESSKLHHEIMENPKKYDGNFYGYETLVLRRNNQPIEIEELIPDPDFVSEWSNTPESERYYDGFWPKYSWKTSQSSEALLSKITWLNT